MKRCLVLATRNRGKLDELARLLADLAVEVLGADDFPDWGEVVEDGATYRENALKKARHVHAATGLPALADDSGLEVDALDGRPGVESARYGGPGLDDAGRVARLLEELAERGVTASKARFRAVVALIDARGDEHICEGVWEGRVAGPPRGERGFGYDPIFETAAGGPTAAELDPAEKDRLSHRGRALTALRQLLAAEPAWLEIGPAGG